MQNLCHLVVDLPILATIIREDTMSAPITHGKGAIELIMMNKTLEESIFELLLRDEGVKPNR